MSKADKQKGRDKQDPSLSPAGQLSGLRKWAGANDRDVVGEYCDDGFGASRFSKGTRDDWLVVMQRISAGETDELAVRQISRSTRDRAVWAALIAACIDNRVMIVVDGRVHDPADPEDGFMLDLQASLAVREAGAISKTTKAGKYETALLGRPAGNLNWGYRPSITKQGRGSQQKSVGKRDPLIWDFETDELRRIELPNDSDLYLREVDPDTGPIFREIITRLLSGEESGESIVRDLIARGIPTLRGGRWTSGNLGRMVVLPAYLGVRVYEDPDGTERRVKGLWPALVTEAEHQALNDLYGDPGRDKFRHSSLTKHLGTGLYRCGREGCDGKMRVIAKGGNHKVNRYSCRICHRCTRTQDPVDHLVERLAVGYLAQPSIAAELAELAGDDPALKAAAAQVKVLTKSIADYQKYARQRRADGKPLPPAEFTAQVEEMRAELAEAEEKARPKHLPGVVFDVAGPEAEAKWRAATIEAKRTILRALFEVTILPCPDGRGHLFDPSLIRVTPRYL